MPASVRPHLGSIVDLIAKAENIPGHRLGQLFLAYLPTLGRISSPSVLCFHTSRLDLDTDGSTDSWGGVATEGSTHKYKGSIGKVDSNATPYFVLPLTDKHTDSNWVGKDHGIHVGDVGVIIAKNKLLFAQLCDIGPSTKLGEASIAAHRFFGHDVMHDKHGNKRARVLDSDVSGDFVTIVFPGSGRFQTMSNAEIESRAKPLFTKLGGML